MKYTLITLALAALSVADTPKTIPPPHFEVGSIVTKGSGCPQGSVDVDWVFGYMCTLYFDNPFNTQVGGDTSVLSQKKECQITINMSWAPGYSFAILNTRYNGWADLNSSVSGKLQTTYQFSGQTAKSGSSAGIVGPYSQVYYSQAEVDALVWSPCSGNTVFNITSEVQLTTSDRSKSGIISTSYDGARTSSAMYILWKKCW